MMKILCESCHVISEGVEPIETMVDDEMTGMAYTGLFFKCPVCCKEWFVAIDIIFDKEGFASKHSFQGLRCRDGQTRYSYERKSMFAMVE